MGNGSLSRKIANRSEYTDEVLYKEIQNHNIIFNRDNLDLDGIYRRSALQNAIFYRSKSKLVETILSRKPDLDYIYHRDTSGWTALMYTYNDFETFNLLLNYDPTPRHVTISDINGDTVLNKVCRYGNIDLIKPLLAIEPKLLKLRNRKNETALMDSCTSMCYYKSNVALLLLELTPMDDLLTYAYLSRDKYALEVYDLAYGYHRIDLLTALWKKFEIHELSYNRIYLLTALSSESKSGCLIKQPDFEDSLIKQPDFEDSLIKQPDLLITNLQSNPNTKGECVICLNERSIMALMPCGHLCLCQKCHPGSDKCPICKTEYVSISRIYIV